jgi:hypothetical protein
VQLCAGFPASVDTADLVDVDVTDINGQRVWVNPEAAEISKWHGTQYLAIRAAQEKLPSAILLFNDTQDPVVVIPVVSSATRIA